ISESGFPSAVTYAQEFLRQLKLCGTQLICLAGYMKMIPQQIIAAYRNNIINIHPALLPRHGGPGMYGIHVHEAVLTAGETESGVTIHVVDEVYDNGRILAQRRVPVLPGDTPQVLQERVRAIEHEL